MKTTTTCYYDHLASLGLSFSRPDLDQQPDTWYMHPTLVLPLRQALPDGPLLLSPDHTGKSWRSKLPLTSDHPASWAVEPSPRRWGHRREDADRRAGQAGTAGRKLLLVSDGDFLRRCGQAWGQSGKWPKSEEGYTRSYSLKEVGWGLRGCILILSRSSSSFWLQGKLLTTAHCLQTLVT